ncbi:MAG: Na+/H+ antiporter subunit E [Candidatus Abyssobacteria bacterium SURF_5]|uniref:Na+/H+ antiporter subunit E n=1 Tax=Abyssobacteria bacterium (strain SURF_5) TaxID=2093360 RepID=A0A3A4P875_ABYX5|nr:MAG: Na+/H+ antiporter subunit E [Candidatus Abyssubacteria bacterium SURF_5]
MILFLFNILLALAWMALTGRFGAANFMAGFVLGYLVLRLTQKKKTKSPYFSKIPQAVGFILFFVWELTKASALVTYDILTPRHRMSPGIVAIPLDARTDAEIVFLANLITLTPGTLSIEVSDDRRVLYVHALYIDSVEGFRRHVKQGFERRLLEVFR